MSESFGDSEGHVPDCLNRDCRQWSYRYQRWVQPRREVVKEAVLGCDCVGKRAMEARSGPWWERGNGGWGRKGGASRLAFHVPQECCVEEGSVLYHLGSDVFQWASKTLPPSNSVWKVSPGLGFRV